MSVEDISAAFDAQRRALVETWHDMPEDAREELFRLGGLGASPVDRIVLGAEIIYSLRDDMPEEAKAAAALGFRVAQIEGFHKLQDDNRGERAASVLEGKEVSAPPVSKRRAESFAANGSQPSPMNVE